jgi:CBS domain containing-hemolysin-like protein
MYWLIAVLVISFLILLTALYVAAEFSAVSARRPRLVQMAAEGNALARQVLPIIRDPSRLDAYIAACQVGITISSLLLGFYGQAQLTPVIAPLLTGLGRFSEPTARTLATTGMLVLLTALQMVLGELVPKAVGIQYPERLALATYIPMRWSMILFRPLIWFFNGSGRLILRVLGKSSESRHFHIHAPQEILMLVEESSAGGQLDREERRLLENSLQLRELAVRQVMVPRNRMLASPVDTPCDKLLSLLADSQYSRLPLYDGSIDNIIGIAHLKDLVCLRQLPGQPQMREVMRDVLFVPETMAADEVFGEMQKGHFHVAIVLDEYGGTAGLVTLEDLIEELFGELKDEFDPEALPPVRTLPDRRVQVRGDVLVAELNELLGLFLPSEGVDTVGGLIQSQLGHIPKTNEKVQIEDLILKVDAMSGKAVAAVSLEVTPEQLQRLQETIQ